MPVCIAGMHRSGTSMVARLLNYCGLYMGEDTDLMGAAPDNPEGFWENVKFVRINEEILARLKGGWDFPPAMKTGWEKATTLKPLLEQSATLLQCFEDREPWGWKDPRNSLTLPFWQQLIPNLKVIICLRNPLEVANSLTRRGCSSYSFSANLWQTYNQHLINVAPLANRLITHYDAYSINAEAELRRLLDFVGFSAKDELIKDACTTFSYALHHNRAHVKDLVPAHTPDDVVNMYIEMCRNAGPVYWETNGHLHNHLDFFNEQEQYSLNGKTGLLIQLMEGKQDIQALSTQLAIKDQMLEGFSSQLREKEQVIQSLSSQLTEKEQIIQSLSSQLREKEQIIQSLSSQLREKEQVIQSLSSQTEEQIQAIESLSSQLREKEQVIQSLLSQADEQIQAIESLSSQLREKEQVIQSLSSQAIEQNQAIKTLSSESDEKERAIQLLSSQVAEREQALTTLSSQVTEKEQTIQLLSAEAAEKDQVAQALTAKVAEKEQSVQVLMSQITPIISSRAWRIILFLWTVRLFLIPHESLREKVAFKSIRQINRLVYSFRNLSRTFRFAIKNGGINGYEPPLTGLEQGLESSSIVTTTESLPLASTAIFMNLLETNSVVTARSFIERAKISIPAHDLQVDIIVCIHNALEDVERCLESIIENTAHPYRLILIDDGSDAPTKEFLENFASTHGTFLLRNAIAMGYTFAANQGLLTATGQYAVLLNSDTIVFAEWLDRLVNCALSSAQIGLVGPLSNTASWQSVPKLTDNGDWARNPLPPYLSLEEFARMVIQVSNRLYPRLSFLNGFCLLVRRQLWEEIGIFDEETFGKGYGEENDYAIRARKSGWELAVADDVWIYHRQSSSYSDEIRLRLAAKADDYLRQKYDATTDIEPGVEQSRNDRVMWGIRARINAAIECKRVLLEGVNRWKELRVGIVIPVADEGGGAHVILQESRALQSMGINVELLNLEQNRQGFHRAYPDCDCSVKFYSSPEELARQTIDGAFPYDFIVCTFNTTPSWFKCFLGANQKPQMVYYIQDFEPKFYTPGSRDYQVALSSYTLISDMRLVTKTKWNQEQLRKQIGIESIILGPSVDIDLFRPRPRMPHSVARLCAMIRPSSPRRAPERTLETLAILHKRLGNKVEIYTCGCTGEELSTLSAYTGFSLEGIRHCGRLTRFQMADLLNSCDIFADYSEFQAMGLTALEAMASGCAVLVPMYGGSSEFVFHNVNGLVVDTHDQNICVHETEQLILNTAVQNQLRLNAINDACLYFPERAAYRLMEAIVN